MIAAIALLFKIVGTAFLVVATIGVLRFEDPFQRMHAATKAGTVGAGLVLVGVMIAMQSTDTTVIGLLTLIFLIGTVPVTGHLLGRAAYVSGAPLRAHEDALAGILPRATLSLEKRTSRSFAAASAPATALAAGAAHAEPSAASAPASGDFLHDVGYEGVRFAVFAPHARVVTRRAMRLADARGTPLTAVAVIDRECLEAARSPAARDAIRTNLAGAIEEMRAETGDSPSRFMLTFEEGDPLALIPSSLPEDRELLVLPTEGWCHHGVRIALSDPEERLTEKLFRVARKHPGPTLFAGFREGEGKRIVILHDGSDRLQRLAAWALDTGLWPAPLVTLVGNAEPDQRDGLRALATQRGLKFEHVRRPRSSGPALLPKSYADSAALILPELPGTPPGRGEFWYDNLASGWRGDVLV